MRPTAWSSRQAAGPGSCCRSLADPRPTGTPVPRLVPAAGSAALHAKERLPVWLLWGEGDEGNWYGFPVHGIPGFKLGKFRHLGEPMDLSGGRETTADREPNEADEALLRRFTEKLFPARRRPDDGPEGLLLHQHAGRAFHHRRPPAAIESVILAAGFSGHGYKFCSVVGEVLARAGAGWGNKIRDCGVWVGAVWVRGY